MLHAPEDERAVRDERRQVRGEDGKDGAILREGEAVVRGLQHCAHHQPVARVVQQAVERRRLVAGIVGHGVGHQREAVVQDRGVVLQAQVGRAS